MPQDSFCRSMSHWLAIQVTVPIFPGQLIRTFMLSYNNRGGEKVVTIKTL